MYFTDRIQTYDYPAQAWVTESWRDSSWVKLCSHQRRNMIRVWIVCCCIVYIRCWFQTCFMHGCIIHAASWYSHLSLSLAALFSQIFCFLPIADLIAVVFLHQPIFHCNSPSFGSLGHWPSLCIHPPFWMCLVWSWLKLPCEVVSVLLRIKIMFQCLMFPIWTVFILTKHVLFVIRLLMFQPSVNTALDHLLYIHRWSYIVSTSQTFDILFKIQFDSKE